MTVPKLTRHNRILFQTVQVWKKARTQLGLTCRSGKANRGAIKVGTLGTSISAPPPRPYDPHGDDPQDEEQEEDGQACALEMGMMLHTLRPPKPTVPMSIAPTSTSPTSTAPEPPKPDPSTEKVHCYDSGQRVTRNMMRRAIKHFCSAHKDVVLDASVPGAQDVTNGIGWAVQCTGKLGCFTSIIISATAIHGCRWELGADDCWRILNRAVDECDRSSTEFKQGGTVDSNCADWRIGELSCVVRIWKI